MFTKNAIAKAAIVGNAATRSCGAHVPQRRRRLGLPSKPVVPPLSVFASLVAPFAAGVAASNAGCVVTHALRRHAECPLFLQWLRWLIRSGRVRFRLGLDESFAELLAGLEARIAFGRDGDGFAGPRITALALLLLLHDEAAKSAQIYALVCLERIRNGSENGLKYRFDLGLFPASLRRHYVNQL
jgi:hypothetical protein